MSGATPNPRQEEAAGLSAAPPPYSVCIVYENYFECMEFWNEVKKMGKE